MLTALVGGLGERAPSIPVIASHIAHDAPLALKVLRSARELTSRQPSTSLTLNSAVEALGLDFVRMLVLAAQPGAAPVASWETGIRVAHLARLIAGRTQLCDAEQAWLAGLAHNLHEYPGFDDPVRRESALLALDANGFAADAVRYCRVAPARIKSAHPLVRVLQLAVSLVYSVHVNGNVSVVGARTALNGLGLEATDAARMQTESEALAQETLRRYVSNSVLENGLADPALAPASALLQGYAALARASALSEAMNRATDRTMLAQKTVLLMQGLFGITASVLLEKQQNSLQPAPWWPAPSALRDLPFVLDDVQSAVSRASAGETSYWETTRADQYAVVDAQLARLMDASSLLCMALGDRHVLIAGNAEAAMASEAGWQDFLHALNARMTQLEGRDGAGSNALAQAAPVDAVPRQEVRRAVHEAANPLTIIRNYVDLLSGKFSRDSDTQRDLAIIGSEIDRVGIILQGLGAKQETSSAAEEMSGTWVDVNQIISELVRMSLDTLFLPNKINVQIDLDPGMGSILTQRDPLKQVLLNLAKNAVEAMPRGGKLTFATARTEYLGRSCVVIVVHDTGPGLPEAVRAQLFQPVPSFKGGEHAGLGLAISQNLMQTLGGNIEYDNTLGGATFRVYLPLSQETHSNQTQSNSTSTQEIGATRQTGRP